MRTLVSPSRQRRIMWELVIPLGLLGVVVIMVAILALSEQSWLVGTVACAFSVPTAVVAVTINNTVHIRAEIHPTRLRLFHFPPFGTSVGWDRVEAVEFDEFLQLCGPVLRLVGGRRRRLHCLRTTTFHRDEARTNTSALAEALSSYRATGDATASLRAPGDAARPR